MINYTLEGLFGKGMKSEDSVMLRALCQQLFHLLFSISPRPPILADCVTIYPKEEGQFTVATLKAFLEQMMLNDVKYQPQNVSKFEVP